METKAKLDNAAHQSWLMRLRRNVLGAFSLVAFGVVHFYSAFPVHFQLALEKPQPREETHGACRGSKGL